MACDGSYDVIYDLAGSTPVSRNSIANAVSWKNGAARCGGGPYISHAVHTMHVCLTCSG